MAKKLDKETLKDFQNPALNKFLINDDVTLLAEGAAGNFLFSLQIF